VGAQSAAVSPAFLGKGSLTPTCAAGGGGGGGGETYSRFSPPAPIKIERMHQLPIGAGIFPANSAAIPGLRKIVPLPKRARVMMKDSTGLVGFSELAGKTGLLSKSSITPTGGWGHINVDQIVRDGWKKKS